MIQCRQARRRLGSIVLLFILLAWLEAAGTDSTLKLRYDKPAEKWTAALPLGNGRIGAMVFGGTEDERLQINESTLWGGVPHDYTDPGALATFHDVRKLIFDGKIEEAEKLSAGMMGNPKLLMPYQPFCDVVLHFAGHAQATRYRRELLLDRAISVTSYRVDGVEFRREVFVSYPDQVLVVRITSSEPKKLTFKIRMTSPQPGTEVESAGKNTLQLTGQIQPRQSSPRSWTGSWDQPGVRFAAILKVLAEGGSVTSDAAELQVTKATSVTILFSNATSFRTYLDIFGDALGSARAHLQRASKLSFERLRQRHLADFQKLFSRVQLQLGDDRSTEMTDKRIKNFVHDEDPNLLALYFEFGRYVLISSSRPGGQPANLQGVWNQDLMPAWGSKWTTNINLEMNYWQADTGDLWETQLPLWSLIRDLRKTGAETARVHYASNGWVLHHNTDLWRATTPVDGPWGIWPTGGAWLANQMWDHYQFSLDREFLEREAYPAMKEAAQFVLDALVEVPAGKPLAGKLVTNPSTSPENKYVLGGKRFSLTYAPTMDIELIRELFENCQQAAEILGTDEAFRVELARVSSRLPPLQIGRRGQLQEWIEDYEEVEPNHRHVSHLYALYPGHDISLKTAPEFSGAARKSLELRGDGGTGWSSVWRVGLWARLQNPQHAYANLKFLLTTSTLPNMFDLCPPFQIDGNLGGPAVMTEMLIQSTPDEITILPALPSQWPDGTLKGVRVRGGAKVDITWKKGKLNEVTVQSARLKKYRVYYGSNSIEIQATPGNRIILDGGLRRANP